MSRVSSRLHHHGGHTRLFEPGERVFCEGSRDPASLRIGIDRGHINLTHTLLGMKLQRDESDGFGALRCDPDVNLLICVNRFDRVPLSHTSIRMVLAIDGGARRLLYRFKDGLTAVAG